MTGRAWHSSPCQVCHQGAGRAPALQRALQRAARLRGTGDRGRAGPTHILGRYGHRTHPRTPSMALGHCALASHSGHYNPWGTSLALPGAASPGTCPWRWVPGTCPGYHIPGTGSHVSCPWHWILGTASRASCPWHWALGTCSMAHVTWHWIPCVMFLALPGTGSQASHPCHCHPGPAS